MKIKEELLELKAKMLELEEKYNQLLIEIRESKEDSGVYLDGVPEFYRQQLQEEISKSKK